MLYRPLLKRSSLLTTTNRLDHLFDLTYTSGIIVNGCLLNLDITRERDMQQCHAGTPHTQAHRERKRHAGPPREHSSRKTLSRELPNEYKARKCHEREVSQAKRRGHKKRFLQLAEERATEEGNRRTDIGTSRSGIVS